MMRGGLGGLLVILLLTCGCMTIAGTPGTVMVNSMPPGIPVYLDTVFQGNTPLVLNQVAPGQHTIEFRLESGATWSTEVQVASGGTSSVAWNVNTAIPEATSLVKTRMVTVDDAPDELYVTDMVGYQGVGNYLTQLTFDLGLSRATSVDMNATTMTYSSGGDTISPYWEITDKRYANMDNILDGGELFMIRMSIPRTGPEDTFTITITPADGKPLVVTKTVPSPIGVTVKIP